MLYHYRFDAIDTVRSIVQELDVSDARKKELQDNIFVSDGLLAIKYNLFIMILEARWVFEISLQKVYRRGKL